MSTTIRTVGRAERGAALDDGEGVAATLVDDLKAAARRPRVADRCDGE
jgi:hypothetical protein